MHALLSDIFRNFGLLMLLSLTFVLGQAANDLVRAIVGDRLKTQSHQIAFRAVYFVTLIAVMLALTYAVTGRVSAYQFIH